MALKSRTGAQPARRGRRFRVYVIRLKQSVWEKSRKYRKANPQYVEGKPHVYVGSTAKTPEERFEAHMAGGRPSSRLVKRFGKKLLGLGGLVQRTPSEGETEPGSHAVAVTPPTSDLTLRAASEIAASKSGSPSRS